MSSWTDNTYEPVINHLRVRGTEPNQVLQANASGQFVPVAVSALGVSMGSAGAAGDLSDVTITSPSHDDALLFNSMSNQWENVPSTTITAAVDATLTSHIGDLLIHADLDDTIVTSTSLWSSQKITDELAALAATATGAVTYLGTWNAETNIPALADGTGSQGEYYVVVGNAFARDLGSGSISWSPSDWAVHNGSIWQKVDNTPLVVSVTGGTGLTENTPTGAITINLDDTAVTPGTYGTSNDVAQITVDQQGRITAASDVAIDHDALTNFVASEHVDHSTVSISAGTGLTGGGDLTATRTLNLANTAVTIGTYGTSGDVTQITVDQQGRLTYAADVAIDHTAIQNIGTNTHAQIDTHIATAATHVDHTAVSITAGTGLSGGGTIDANRTLNMNVNSLAAVTAVAGDYVTIEDVTDNTTKKALVSDIVALAGAPPTALNDLTDVSVAAPVTNQVLHYTAGNWTQVAAIDNSSTPTVLEGHLPVAIGGTTYYIQLFTIP